MNLIIMFLHFPNYIHCKNKITKSFVSAVARNNGNYNLISHVASYDCMVTYNVHVLIKQSDNCSF